MEIEASAALAIFLGVMTTVPVSGTAAPSTNAPPTRHVVVVENSANMKAQREPTADLVSRMMLDGFRGRMRVGEVVELWVIEEEVNTNALRAFRWHPIAAIDDSNSAYRHLRSLKSSAKTVALDEIFSRLDVANPKIPRLLVYLATSGSDPIRGTPFDERINPIFQEHHQRLAEEGHAFVTVLAAQEGEWVGHGVTPGDRNPFIPLFPPMEVEPEPPAVIAPTNTVAPPVTPSVTITNRPATLTADEIALKMREAALERALTSAPPASVSVTNRIAEVASSSPPPVPSPAPKPTPTRSAVTNLLEERLTAPVPEPAPTNREPPAVIVTNAIASPTAPEKPPRPTNALAASSTDVRPPSKPRAAPSEPARRIPEAPQPRHTPPPLGEQFPELSPWKDLLVGITLLTAAAALAVLLIRQMTHRPRSSLISQSLGSPPGSTGRPPGRDS